MISLCNSVVQMTRLKIHLLKIMLQILLTDFSTEYISLLPNFVIDNFPTYP